jgi:alpha-ketoglutaric semialdehyde dehydrogenase
VHDVIETMEVTEVANFIGGDWVAGGGGWFDKLSPHSGERISRVARSNADDVNRAVAAAKAAQPAWAALPPVRRGDILHEVCMRLRERREEMARLVALETGKSVRDARGETDGAISLGLFYAGEGQRLYGRTTTSGAPNKKAMTVRQPLGVAGLIIAANTPIANVAWKVFPALICGNAAVLKAAEDTPATAWLFGEIAQQAGLPAGVLNIIQGFGEEAGAPLVAHPDVAVISFTGSTAVGKHIAQVAGQRLAKVSLELGGKNPLIVCDDADLDNAVKWSVLSAFSNAGQRCAAGSRLIVFDAVYEQFKEKLIAATERLRLGPADDDDFGPVINAEQLDCMVSTVERARAAGANIVTGGTRSTRDEHRKGFYMVPTIIENVARDAEISKVELFGPITCLYRVRDFQEAMELANDSPYGLTASIHTKSIHRALEFVEKIQSGVAMVNAGTYGSEPHMPFGGVKQSGNGSREPGTEALDIYSNLKDVYIVIDSAQL